mgnify:CR=1 FL=1|jgi:cytochrome b pre-mRNA-processing protein 3
MIFKSKKHKADLYNTLLALSRNIFFYDKIKLNDSFETRIYLMFMHFSIMLIIFKSKETNFKQELYDGLFYYIENDLRELGLGDVAVNKKMKNLNKIFYDILLKIKKKNVEEFNLNSDLIIKYFTQLNKRNNENMDLFKRYFIDFYNFCFELPLNNMLRETINFKK